MKKLLLVAASAICALSMNAQINVGANFLTSFPVGNWGDVTNTGFGGSVEGNYFVNEDISVGLEIGLLSYSIDGGVEGLGGSGSFRQIPIIVKGEYYFLDDKLRPFVGLGIGFYTGKSTYTISVPFFGPQSIEGDLSGLGLYPRVGATYEVSDLINLVLSVNYHLMLTQKTEGENVDDKSNAVVIGLGARFNLFD